MAIKFAPKPEPAAEKAANVKKPVEADQEAMPADEKSVRSKGKKEAKKPADKTDDLF